jgi:acetyl-CoA synthetase
MDSLAAEDPDALAVLSLEADGEVAGCETAVELASSTRTAARALLDLGVGKGDHVFVMLPRIPEFYAAMLGAMRIGAVPMPGANLLTAKDIAYRIDAGGAVAAITDVPERGRSTLAASSRG